MDWVLEHLRIIVIAGGAVAYWLNQRRKAKEEAEAARTLASTPPVKTQANDDAERVRRIQEEIRRKIQERASGAGGMSERQRIPMEQASPTPPPIPTAQAKADDAYSQSTADQLAASDQVVLDQQLQLATKFRELEGKRRQSMGKAEVFAEKTAEGMAASDTADRGSLLADLRNPTLVRRAIILREVLGPPVGLT